MRKITINAIMLAILFLSLRQAEAASPDSLKINLLKGDYKTAIFEGEKLCAENPHSDEISYLLGVAYLKNGDYLSAAGIFEKIIKDFNSSGFRQDAEIALGDTYLLRGDTQRAEAYYRGLLVRNPDTKFKSLILQRLNSVDFCDTGSSQTEKRTTLGGYSVQVGSFGEQKNAANLVKKLVSGGYQAHIEENNSAAVKSYRVKVGNPSTLEEADDLSKNLLREGYPTKICQ